MPRKGMDEIVLILDRSGSMSSVWPSVETGVPEFIKGQRDEQGRDAKFTLVAFDYSEDMITAYMREKIQLVDVEALPSTIFPRGMTALYDAIGYTIDRIGREIRSLPEDSRPENVIVAIYTDGMENASRNYDRDRIAGMIRHQEQKYNWKFMFLGAGIDAFAGGGAIGIMDVSIKGTRHDLTGTIGSTSGLGAYTSCLRSGGTSQEASKAFDTNYMAVVGETPEQTTESTSDSK